ncbi:MAG: peptidoglycan-associated lipoprotein Pal [Betaproteobacteria bacterium]|nr:peptidoglycan-associated lipoprotein Pal [Betaproteobacteria bacterium]
MNGVKILISVIAFALLGACSTVKLTDKAPPVEDRNASSASSGGSSSSGSSPSTSAGSSGNTSKSSGASSASSASAVDPVNDPSNILSKRSIYFDYDQYTVKEEYRSLVEAHGKFLASNPDRKVIIQGNTDERGGSEYNLALGQKRAEAVRRAMALAGARDSQMEAISFGKEKPKASGSDEAAWMENRRADIVY